MTKRSAQLLGVLVICLGVLLALPFRRAAPQPLATSPAPALASSELNLQQKGEGDADRTIGQAPTELSPDGTPLKLTPISQAEPGKLRPLSTERTNPQFELPTRPVPSLADSYQPPTLPKRPPPKPTADELPRRHLVVDGDTLEGLALRYLGSRQRAREILRANRGLDPQLLPVRRYIIIPPKFPPRRPARPARTKLVPID